MPTIKFSTRRAILSASALNAALTDWDKVSDRAVVACLLNLEWEVQGKEVQEELKLAKSCFYNGTTLVDLVTTRDECGKTCIDNFEGTYFFWHSTKGGVSTLKGGQGDWMETNLIVTTETELIYGFVISRDGVIDWQVGDNRKFMFAGNCDFADNFDDISNTQSNNGDCGNFKCTDCTHFTWIPINRGTCWMKKGENNWKVQAFQIDYNSTCVFKSDT